MTEPLENKDKHETIKDLHHIIASYVDTENPAIKTAKQHFESAYKAYEQTPEDYLTGELAVASAKSMVETVFSESNINTPMTAPSSELHHLADQLTPDKAQWMHQAIHDIDEYTFWHKEHEFDDHPRSFED